MSERRSSRSRGTVKYSGFDDGNESDDDFAVPSHPPKKQKSSKTDESANKSVKDKSLNLLSDSKHVITLQNSPKTSRRAPLSEKIYERELQEALELSRFETGKSQDVVNHDLDNRQHQPSEALTFTADVAITNSGQLVASSGNVCTKPHSQKSSVNTATKVTSNTRHPHGTVVMDESIELAESDNGDCSNPQQKPTRMNHDRPAHKKPRLVDKDDASSDESDYDPDDDSYEDESTISGTKNYDDEEEESRSNCRSKKMKATNSSIKNKSSTITSKTSNSVRIGITKGARKMLVKSQLSESPNSAAVSSSASSLCFGNSPSCVTIPSTVSTKSASSSKLSSQKIPSSLVSQWKPPSRASPTQASADTVRSPSSGLRLGLSRNQRVKPLHPSVQVS